MSKSDYSIYLDEYKQQKEIEAYQNKRQLPVPKTNKAGIIIYILLLVLLFASVALLSAFLISALWLRILINVLAVILILETYGRFLGIKCVECYQHYATEDRRRRCICVPSCSEYAILCFKKFELIYALIKIRKRLFVTCQGPDYRIDWP